MILHWYAKRGILNKVCEARKRHVQIKGHAAFFVLFCQLPYKICKMDFEDPSYTAPSGLILPGLGILDRHTSLADRCLPGLPEGNPLWTPLNKLGKRVSPTYGRPAGVACFHGGNLTVSPSQESTPFQLLRRNASHFLQHTGAKPLRKTCHLAQVFLPPKRCRKVIFFGSF